ncbi:CbiM family transporter [Halalkalibacterium ligniniphilum]|uniref:CbiM family transporter n=1 Tax=Halalkalibacterium ligniniphilum TaxID=1134413 RepID=UPI000347CEE0|nr:CbiM family transporter [Halalkalibacterium ligniniphilum]
MHLSDGVLSFPVVVTTSVVAGALVVYSIRGIKEREIPQISLMTAAFFVLSLISIPIGPSSVHPILCGLLGLVLGKRSPLAIFVGLLLQALLFQHGGITTLGANIVMLSIPAMICHYLFIKATKRSQARVQFIAAVCGGIGVIGAVFLLTLLLALTSSFYTDGMLSVVRILIIGHLPLVIIEALLTGFIVATIVKIRPAIILGESSNG